MKVRKVLVFVSMVLSSFSMLGMDDSWKCQWFGIGCEEGSQNQTLLDVGRQRTIESFLFFDADSALIERTIEFSFSERSASYGDYLELQWTGDALPEGSRVTLNGSSVLAPSWYKVEASPAPWRGTIQIQIPPTGDDHEIQGGLSVRAYGFERAGSQELGSNGTKPISMLRVQGSVDSDWHWFKRGLFWLIAVTFTIVALWKWIVAPVRFGRFRIPRLVMGSVVQDSGNAVKEKVFTNLSRGLFRRGTRIIQLSGRRKMSNPFEEFMHGKSVHYSLPSLGNQIVEIKPLSKDRRKGARIQVRWFENKREKTHTIYRKTRRKGEKDVLIPLESGKHLLLTFDLNR
tara:strand:- start:973 stop:2004 length:1032 start_codon:yes stop_codon:yes gene_type:complete